MNMRSKERSAPHRLRGIRPVALTLAATALAACSLTPSWHATPSDALLAAPIVEPDNSRPIASGVRVRMDSRYAIADFAEQEGVYYVVGEVHASDNRTIYMRGCGRDARLTLSEPAGNIRLYCDMRVPVEGPESHQVHLAIRLYQRTAADMSQMIATSEPMLYELRNNDVIHRQLDSMSPCADIMQDDGMVHICRD